MKLRALFIYLSNIMFRFPSVAQCKDHRRNKLLKDIAILCVSVKKSVKITC